MTLNANNVNLGLGASQEQSTHETWDSYETVFEYLLKTGFTPTAKPSFSRPVVEPEQYAKLEGDEYSILMGKVDRWFDYTRSMQAELDGRLIAIRNEMDIIGVDMRATVRREVDSRVRKKPSESEMKDLVKENPRYRELMKSEQDLEIAKKQVDAIAESLERYAKGLSRQVTVRGQNIEISGMNTGRKPPRPLT